MKKSDKKNIAKSLNSSAKNIKQYFKKKLNQISKNLEEDILKSGDYKLKIITELVNDKILGNVLRINNIECGTCSYDCLYCPGGRKEISSNICLNQIPSFVLFYFAKHKVEELESKNIRIDCIALRPNGESSLDVNLFKTINMLKNLKYKIAVYTNGSMLWNYRIRENLLFADTVILKLDTLNFETWLKLNDPHPRLRFDLILDGIKLFSNSFSGKLITETMLVKGVNDSEVEIHAIAKFLKQLDLKSSIFRIPSLPASKKISQFEESNLAKIGAIISSEVPNSEMFCCPEYQNIFTSDDIIHEVQDIIRNHPIEKELIIDFFREKAIPANLLKEINSNEINFAGKKYLISSN